MVGLKFMSDSAGGGILQGMLNLERVGDGILI